MRTYPNVLLCLLIAGCHDSATHHSPLDPATSPSASPAAADAFFARLGELCGKAYAGRLGAHAQSDLAAFGGAATMHVRECNAREIRIPFHVGQDHSRTWIITRTTNGLRLKHDHRHEDGAPDEVTLYGGDSLGADAGSAGRQEFPADAESKAMFTDAGMQVSIANIWAIEIEPGKRFVYELRRPDRHFSVEFDLDRPIALPPAPWGSGHVTPTATGK